MLHYKRYTVSIKNYNKILYFLPYMRHYIQTVCKGFKYHIETNDFVKKNQVWIQSIIFDN